MNDTTLGNTSLLPVCVNLPSRDVTLIPNVIGPILRLPLNIYILQLIISARLITSEFYALKEAIFEIIICLYDILEMMAYVFPNSCLLTIKTFFLGFIVSGRPFLLTLICVERYLAVGKPVVFLRLKPLKYKLALSGITWLWTLVSCFSVFLMGSVYHYAAVAQMTMCCVVKLSCCVATLLVLKQPGPGEGVKQREGMSSIKLKAFRIMLIITVSVILVNVPLIIVVALKDYLTQTLFDSIVNVCYTFTAFSGLVHGLLFLLRSGKLSFIKFL